MNRVTLKFDGMTFTVPEPVARLIDRHQERADKVQKDLAALRERMRHVEAKVREQAIQPAGRIAYECGICGAMWNKGEREAHDDRCIAAPGAILSSDTATEPVMCPECDGTGRGGTEETDWKCTLCGGCGEVNPTPEPDTATEPTVWRNDDGEIVGITRQSCEPATEDTERVFTNDDVLRAAFRIYCARYPKAQGGPSSISNVENHPSLCRMVRDARSALTAVGKVEPIQVQESDDE